MTYENDASSPKKKWLRKEHEDIIILLKIFVQKNGFCMKTQISDSADTCRKLRKGHCRKREENECQGY